MATKISAQDDSGIDDTHRDSVLVIRKSVTVPLPQKAAFKLFTEEIGTWWPAITHSVAGSSAARVGMEPELAGQIYEETGSGTVTWGTITAWDAPELFSTTWHPGYGFELATQLTVRFIAEGPRTTRVELEHRGWEVLGEAADEQFQGYTSGWDPVLEQYVASAGS